MYVRLNLATKPLETHRRFLAGAALLGALAGLLFLILGLRFYSLRKADADLRVKSSQYQQEMANLEEQRRELDRFFSQGETVKLQGRANFIRNVIEARSINWTQMFMDLEKTLPRGVRIVRIEPKLDKGTVTVKFVVGATNEDAKVKLLKAFEDSKSFSSIEMESVRTASQGTGDPLTIEFSAVYTRI
jgi:Tfp pilus assembly protein PilN